VGLARQRTPCHHPQTPLIKHSPLLSLLWVWHVSVRHAITPKHPSSNTHPSSPFCGSGTSAYAMPSSSRRGSMLSQISYFPFHFFRGYRFRSVYRMYCKCVLIMTKSLVHCLHSAHTIRQYCQKAAHPLPLLFGIKSWNLCFGRVCMYLYEYLHSLNNDEQMPASTSIPFSVKQVQTCA